MATTSISVVQTADGWTTLTFVLNDGDGEQGIARMAVPTNDFDRLVTSYHAQRIWTPPHPG